MSGLSKSRYVMFRQCEKSLWLEAYKKNEKKIDDSRKSIFENGQRVGDIAKGLFGPYVDVTTYKPNSVEDKDLVAMVAKTKSVLPALFPNDPSLDYHNLTGGVQNGNDAMSIFPKIKDMNPTDAQAAREALLRYCELDTWAMVKVLEKLKSII